MNKRILLLAGLVLSTLPSMAWIITGKCGETLTFSLNTDTETLTIEGTGAMTNYSEGKAPWYSHRSSVRKVVLPEGLTQVGSYAFANCTQLDDIMLPNTVERMGDHAFAHCTSLTDIEVPAGVTSLSGWSFFECTGLQNVTMHEGLTTIGSNAFYGCTAMADLELPATLTTISNGAFEYCTSLTEITLPKSVTAIGDWAFAHSTNLTDVYSYCGKWPYTGINILADTNVGHGTLYVPAELMDKYRANSYWKACGTMAKAMEECDTPTIRYEAGNLLFSSATEGARYHYSVRTVGADITNTEGETLGGVAIASQIDVTVYATAEGYRPSDKVTQRFTMQQGSLKGDMNGDDKLTIEDVTKLVNKVLGREE